MKPVDFLIIFIILAIIGAAAFYVRRSKKKGHKCIGCPDSGACNANCPGCKK